MDKPHYVPHYFYFNDGINKIDLMDAYNLADLAISLIPKEDKIEDYIDDNKINKSINLLNIHMDNYILSDNHDNDQLNNLISCYNLINTYDIGKELLFKIIYFKLWNKFLLNKGLSPDIINSFTKAHDDLNKIECMGTINQEVKSSISKKR